MNGFLLDTNILSEQTKQRPERVVMRWLSAQPDHLLFLSAITVGELRKGIALLPASRRRDELEEWFGNRLLSTFTGRILPVTSDVANRWGTLSALRQRAGTQLGISDGLIAATALEHHLTLVTRNVKDFDALGVPIFNPWDLAE